MRTALQREQHCRATWCDRVRGKRQMSDRIRLSVTTVQKTQNRKTLGGVGGGAVLTPHSLPVAPAAFGQHTDVRDRWRSRAGKRSRGERRGGGSPPPPRSRRRPPLRRQNDAVQTPAEHGYSFGRTYTGLPYVCSGSA